MHHRILVVLLATASVANAQPADPPQPQSASIAAAEQLFNEARTLSDKGDHASACPRFEASYKLDPALGTLLNIATCYEKVGKLASAWGRYREVIAVAAKVGDDARLKIARDKADALEPKLPKLTIRARATIAGMVIMRDDVPVDPATLGVGIYVDAGSHSITATALGRKPFTIKVEVPDTGTKVIAIPDLMIDPEYKGPQPAAAVIHVEQEHFDPGRTRRIIGLSLGGAGIATIVAGLGFGAVAKSTYETAFDDDLCNRTTLACTPKGQDRTDRARSQSLVSNLMTAGGIAMLAGGVVLYVTAPTPGRISDLAWRRRWRSRRDDRRSLVRAALLLLAGCKTIVGIEDTSVPPDAAVENKLVDTGDGHDGPIVVVADGFTDDVRAGITVTVGEGSTLLQVTSSDGFAPGDEVVLIQMTGDAAGHYETGRVRSGAPGSLTLERAVGSGFPADPTSASQVIHVPNFSSVTVGSTGRLRAHAWDGITGGVVFFRVSGALQIDPGGLISADATGFAGGLASAATLGGVGGNGGGGGAHLNCPTLGCNINVQNAQGGGNGDFTAAADGDDGAQHQLCHAGKGGAGGSAGTAADLAMPGEVGQGLGGAILASAGGSNVTLGINGPLLGGGGAGGTGGTGGIGGAGGGGGGGPVGGNNPAGQGDGSPGGKGLGGGDGGAAGVGGVGGGIVIIAASTILVSGEISATGGDGAAGIDGVVGGLGGFGGFSGPAPACSGASIPGGRGGGGAGAMGGNGGGGGGGGGGGVIQLAAEELHLTGTLHALGGGSSNPGAGGGGGAGGDGFGDPDTPAATGPAGSAGTPGSAGSPGFIYISFVDTCDGCGNASDPAAGLSDL